MKTKSKESEDMAETNTKIKKLETRLSYLSGRKSRLQSRPHQGTRRKM